MDRSSVPPTDQSPPSTPTPSNTGPEPARHAAKRRIDGPSSRRATLAIAAGAAVAGTAASLLDTVARPDNLATGFGAGGRPPRDLARPLIDMSRTVDRPSKLASQDDRDASFAAALEKKGKPGKLQQANAPTSKPKPGQQQQFSGYAEAARAGQTHVNVLVSKAGKLTDAQARRHLLNRATFGPRPKDVADLQRLGIDKWLSQQLATGVTDVPGNKAWSAFPLAGANADKVRRSVKEYAWDAMFQTGQATLGRQVFGDRQLYEVVVDLFANHLNVATPSDRGWDVAADYQVNVIRKYAYGKFSDMLQAAMRHPAMLRFLDNDQSNKRSVNENLGRELLELHTVGVASGYTEKDVRNSAYILTGRTTTEQGAFKYEQDAHYTGSVKVLNFSSANGSASGGLGVGDKYLDYLAHHPATARTVARKIAVRFVGDVPSTALVDRLAKVYLDKQTDIRAVLSAMFRSREFWDSFGDKTRRPLDDMVASARVLDLPFGAGAKEGLEGMYWQLSGMGHAPLAWAPPNGYPDVAAAWMSSGQMLERWTGHRALAYGWWKGLKRDLLPDLQPKSSDTYSVWFARISRKLVGQGLDTRHLKALQTFVDAPITSRVDLNRMKWQGGHVVALVLDSPYFLVR